MSELGFVNERDNRAIVRLKVHGAGQETFLNLEIDTGAGLELVLPGPIADSLGIARVVRRTARLADGSSIPADEGLVEIDWLGKRVVAIVVIFAGEGDFAPINARRHAGRANGLIGRELLRTSRLTIDYPNRTVTIEPSTASH